MFRVPPHNLKNQPLNSVTTKTTIVWNFGTDKHSTYDYFKSTFVKMMRYIPYFLSLLIGFTFLQPFHTKELYNFASETSEGVAALLYFHDQLVDTISLDKLQTTANSAVYIEFKKYSHAPPYDDWEAKYGEYGGEGNYRVFHNGHNISEAKLPYINKFSSPRLHKNHLIYWGFLGGKVYGFRTDLTSFTSDSVLIFDQVIGTDFKYSYNFPIPKDSLYLFRTWFRKPDSLLVNFDESLVIKSN